MKEQLESIREAARQELAKIESRAGLDAARVRFLGKKGELTAVLKQMGKLTAEERPVIGQLANEVRAYIEQIVETREKELKAEETARQLENERIDVTMPGKCRPLGHKHPLSIVLDEVKEIFLGMGFEVATGPEVEWDYYNFEALNIPPDHPARDTQDTFYITEKMLLRTQTSPVQIRVMEQQKPPIRIIAPGRVYRSDAVDATHSPLFHQIEALWWMRISPWAISRVRSRPLPNGSMATIRVFVCGRIISHSRSHPARLTYPASAAAARVADVQGRGRIEILGGGMVHPKVLQNGGIDPEKYSGFAFGVGLERLVMFRFNIDDMRLLYENDMRFLSQF